MLLERLRQQTHATIRSRATFRQCRSLAALAWRGCAVGGGQTRFPIWVIGSIAIAIVAALFLWCVVAINARSDALYASLLGAPPSSMPRINRAALIRPPPPVPSGIHHARPAPGSASIRERPALLTVLGTPTTIVLRISTDRIFADGSAAVLPASVPLLERIGGAVKARIGPRTGPARSTVTRTTAPSIRWRFRRISGFPRAVPKPSAISCGGPLATRSKSQPRAGAKRTPSKSNATASGREQNRRVEIRRVAAAVGKPSYASDDPAALVVLACGRRSAVRHVLAPGPFAALARMVAATTGRRSGDTGYLGRGKSARANQPPSA